MFSAHPHIWFCSVLPEVKLLSNKGHSRAFALEYLTLLRRKNNWLYAICYCHLKSHYRLRHHQDTTQQADHNTFPSVPTEGNLSSTAFHHHTTDLTRTHRQLTLSSFWSCYICLTPGTCTGISRGPANLDISSPLLTKSSVFTLMQSLKFSAAKSFVKGIWHFLGTQVIWF